MSTTKNTTERKSTIENSNITKTLGFIAGLGAIFALSFPHSLLAANSNNTENKQTVEPTTSVDKGELVTDRRYGNPNYGNNRGYGTYGRDRTRIEKYSDPQYDRAIYDLDKAVSKCRKSRLDCNVIASRVEVLKSFANIANLQSNHENLVKFANAAVDLFSADTDALIGMQDTRFNQIIQKRQSDQYTLRDTLLFGDNIQFKGARGILEYRGQSARNFAHTFTREVMGWFTSEINSLSEQF